MNDESFQSDEEKESISTYNNGNVSTADAKIAVAPSQDDINDRRTKIAALLKNSKEAKLNHKLNSEKQLLHYAKEEINLKRKLIEKLEKSDKEFNESFKEVSKSMKDIGGSIKEGFSMLASLLKPEGEQRVSVNQHTVPLKHHCYVPRHERVVEQPRMAAPPHRADEQLFSFFIVIESTDENEVDKFTP